MIRAGWALLGVLIVGLIISGGALIADAADRTVAGMPTAQDDQVAPAPSTARRPATAPAIPEDPIPPVTDPEPVPPGGTVNVAGTGNERTIVCDGNDVNVSGVGNAVTLSGRCLRVDISGVANIVAIEEAEQVVVSGVNNAVTIRSGTTDVSKSGIGNTVNGE